MGTEFKGAGAVKCGRCDGTGVCRTCNGDGSRKPTEAYLEKRRLVIEASKKSDAAYSPGSMSASVKESHIAQVESAWPAQWMACNACKNQSGICPGCNGKGWVKVEPSVFGRGSSEE